MNHCPFMCNFNAESTKFIFLYITLQLLFCIATLLSLYQNLYDDKPCVPYFKLVFKIAQVIAKLLHTVGTYVYTATCVMLLQSKQR